jgi:DNA-binding response OmpR family regulator
VSKLLLLEDDESLGQTLTERLSLEHYQVHWAKTRAEAELACGTRGMAEPPRPRGIVVPFDLLILDIGLPDGSGLDFARDLRFVSSVPIIFLSALSSPEYRLEGFEIGAEDYVPKPFHLKELLLRVRKVLDAHRVPQTVDANGFSLDVKGLSVVFPDGRREFPAPRDFQLLCMLVENAPKVISREEILAKLWAGESAQTGRTVDNAIVRLRQLLRSIEGDPIRSVRGIGYQFVASKGTGS